MPLYEINGRKPVVGEGTWIAPSAEIIGDVRIGKRCYIGFGAIIRGDYGTIIIGDQTAIEETCMIHARPMQVVQIGNRVTVGHMVMIHGSTIMDNAVIGMHATLSDNAEIGEWAIVAEHALVVNKQKIPGYKVYGGVPAKEIGDVTQKHMDIWNAGKQVYVDLTYQYPQSFKRID